MFKILYLPTAESVETPDWLYDTREAYTSFINDPEIRFYVSIRYNALSATNGTLQQTTKIRYTSIRPDIQHLCLGDATEVEKYHLEVIEVPDE